MQKFLKTKFATWTLAAILAAVLFMTARTVYQKYTIDKQISDLQTRADKIKGDNQQLSDLVKYLNTPQYQEKEAREKLNLKKDGEYVVALPKQNEDTSTSATTDESIPKKWFDYFFKQKS